MNNFIGMKEQRRTFGFYDFTVFSLTTLTCELRPSVKNNEKLESLDKLTSKI